LHYFQFFKTKNGFIFQAEVLEVFYTDHLIDDLMRLILNNKRNRYLLQYLLHPMGFPWTVNHGWNFFFEITFYF